MPLPIEPNKRIRAQDFIFASERQIDPADDYGRGIKLNEQGKVSEAFLRDRQEFIFTEDDTFIVPDWGDVFIVELWGAGGGGGALVWGGGTARSVASGGSSGEYAVIEIPLQALNVGQEIPVVIGVGGAGGVSTNTVVGNGAAGGVTSFGEILKANGGLGGTALGADSSARSVGNRTGNRSATTNDTDILPAILLNIRGLFGGGASTTGNIANNGQSGRKLGGGGGGATHSGSATNNAGLGGTSLEVGKGGDGKAGNGVQIAEAGGIGAGGGAASAFNTPTANGTTGGKGGNGMVKVTVLTYINT